MTTDGQTAAWQADQWEAWDAADPFEASNGVIFRRTAFTPSAEELVRIGFRVAPKNCNMNGVCHGGIIAALMDIAMGRNAWASAGRGAPTVSMNVDFVRAASVNEWIESRARVIRRTRRLLFCDGLLIGDKGVIARGSGLFAIPDAPAP